MADHIDTEILAFDSQSLFSSPASGSKVKNLTGDCQQCQDSVPFDDTMVFDSPLVETQLENQDFDTQEVDYLVCVEDVMLHFICDYEREVVLDSEDEGIHRTKTVSVANAVKLKMKNLSPPSEKAEDILAESDASTDHEHHTEIQPRKIVRTKSPSFSRAKGPQSLARRIKAGTPLRDRGAFECVDIDEHGGGDFLSNRVKASFEYGGSWEEPAVRLQKARCPTSKKGCSSSDECEEKKEFVYLHVDLKDSTHPGSTFVENCPSEICKIEQVSEMRREYIYQALG